MKKFYLIVAVLGIAAPYYYLFLFLTENGFDLALFISQMFETHAGALFSVDVLVSSLALWLFVFIEGPKRGMKNLWLYVFLNFTVGVSFALPLFLYFRQGKLDAEKGMAQLQKLRSNIA